MLRRPPRLLPLALLTVALVLGGCGTSGQSEAEDADRPSGSPTADVGPSSPAPGEPTELQAPTDDTWTPWSKGGPPPTDLSGQDSPAFTVGGDLGCVFSGGPADAAVRCDRREGLGVDQPRPASCDGTWGDAVRTTARGRTALVCAVPADDVLATAVAAGRELDGAVRYDGLTCTSRDAAVQCLGPGGRGFVVSPRVVVTR